MFRDKEANKLENRCHLGLRCEVVADSGMKLSLAYVAYEKNRYIDLTSCKICEMSKKSIYIPLGIIKGEKGLDFGVDTKRHSFLIDGIPENIIGILENPETRFEQPERKFFDFLKKEENTPTSLEVAQSLRDIKEHRIRKLNELKKINNSLVNLGTIHYLEQSKQTRSQQEATCVQ